MTRARDVGRFARKVRQEARAAADVRPTPDLAPYIGLSILDVMAHPALFGPIFAGPTWDAWRVFLAALFGLPLTEGQLAQYTALTARTSAPTTPAREAWLVVGRRGGKSRIAALIAVYLAAFKSCAAILAPGERGTVMLLAADRKQARVCFRYVLGLLDAVPALSALVTARRAESVDLSNGVSIEVHTASYRTTRGYTLIAVLLDEIAFFNSDESTNPDSEIVAALRPGLATTRGILLGLSTPYARRGELWRAYERHYGKDGDVLVVQAGTAVMNPAVDPAVIAQALEDDPAAAEAEYLAQFRRDVEVFLPPEAIAAVTVLGRLELPRIADTKYNGFVDPSGGSQDSFTLAIAHMDKTKAVLDAVRERRPPFSPEDVVKEYAELLKGYGIREVWGDRYAGEWPRERFQQHGITYRPVARSKSELYAAVLPLVMGGRCELVDNKTLRFQFEHLERRTSRSGKDSIDHPPLGRDDLCNSAAGALVLAADRKKAPIASGDPAVYGEGRGLIHGSLISLDDRLDDSNPRISGCW